MAESKQVASLLGPTLVALTASEIANPAIWSTVPVTQVYLAGALWFVAGLSIVRAHNRWLLAWPVVVTLMGWFAVLGGLYRMFAPDAALRGTPGPAVLLALQVSLLAIGLYLTFKALVQRGR
ncbi:hypothetical protein [uncultured Piscinibacter sp.]|uniref:hypothetical protein n=1 Tax=uncultured Piscinibacter sp. TaxID=1131835 RepID=UPI002635627A|nr:hypothetical protein [uncultured Piscinibacter sp.]